MRNIMDRLLAMQQIQFTAGAKSGAVVVELEKLRAEIPAPILAHFDRLGARGKKGVALVRNGVCSGCHLRITAGKLVSLSAHPGEIHLCDNCDRYLHLPAEVPDAGREVKTRPPGAIKRTPKKVVAHVL